MITEELTEKEKQIAQLLKGRINAMLAMLNNGNEISAEITHFCEFWNSLVSIRYKEHIIDKNEIRILIKNIENYKITYNFLIQKNRELIELFNS